MNTKKNNTNEPLYIFDTTLRDGEQSPGASMTLDEKVSIANALERLRVDIIEAGFAAASEGDFASIAAVASRVKNAQVCSLSRAIKADIDTAARAVEGACRPRIHTFIGTSPIHMAKKLGMSADSVLEAAVSAVKHARRYTDNVEFSPEDAGRSDPDFLCRIIEAAIAAGATTINIPDTVGYTVPEVFGALFTDIIARVPNSDKAIFSVHCHNDLGLAVANSLAAVQGGARQIECTMNGLGERAGNTALEEVVMAVNTRQDRYPYALNIETPHLVPTSRLVANITGFAVQPNKAIVGANAFAHEAGIHQAGVLKHRETYEVMRAQDVGWQSNQLVLGKHSGRAAVKARLAELGVAVEGDALDAVFTRFKALADQKHNIYDDDLLSLVHTNEGDAHEAIQLLDITLTNERTADNQEGQAYARLGVSYYNDEYRVGEARAAGMVDAVFQAIEAMVVSNAELVLYQVSNITDGGDAQGEVTVRLRKDDRVMNGVGHDTDVVVASAKAYIDAINRLHANASRQHPQHTL